MAYEPTEWKKGDKITAEKLNKLENGVAAIGGVKVVSCVDDTLTATYAELVEAITSGTVAFVYIDSEDANYAIELVTDLSDGGDIKTVVAKGSSGVTRYTCSNDDDYPHLDLS